MLRFFMHIIIMALIGSACLFSCSPAAEREEPPELPVLSSYNLSSPDASYELPNSLREISGISWYKHDQIACIQDEKARIYLFNIKDQKISSSHSFGKAGDYEDLAVLNDTAWALTSSGTVYRIKDFTADYPEITRHPTGLSAKNDTEGLALNIRENYLLIACKSQASLKGDEPLDGYKAVYRYNTLHYKLVEKPEILIDSDLISIPAKAGSFRRMSLKLARDLHLSEGEVFRPSGLAFHPYTEELYMISAHPGILIVLDHYGMPKHIQPLDPGLFAQAEGICFSAAGDLYISNEGTSGPATILEFKYVPQ